ncbi:5-formyltetrahydrofolate cyclo-ligase [Haloplanus aerogenes]|uniref:5-formyltetrahydrofolate cyclo-ligase n=1 Tax=Haloplanus aerogenes TaxID=660522 RepID=A0A3M0DYJ5_9EURY|nr:5-formyltetrahydrofolate cyclo-ligase [Haloplanus aerogenes]AZH24156.1 5-formyltetrahydrofolate cyclo-ligase [Haloplanus aerogenes]RMB24226.1 5-formyltetrahydrofolate cyclo-ligase [Haloplanus aerogenes]
MDKQALRERVWDDLEESGEARFPFPPHGRIPNFAGASEAAGRLTATAEWQAADTVKSNPDAPQLPVRRAALRAGKTVYVAVPRLRDEHPFRRLDPDAIDDYDAATTVSGIDEYGTPVDPEEMARIDLIVSGSVAVNEVGARVGKGEGYSDLEFAVLRGFDLVDDGTTTATTVHERQVVADVPSPAAHDVPMDLVVTPERVVRSVGGSKPSGIDWNALDDERIEAMPILVRLREV